MGSSLYLFMFMHFFFLPSCFHFIILTNSSSSKLQANHLCLDDERFALLQFNQSLSLNEAVSWDPSAYPKVASWKLEGDCCSWDGVDCDDDTGHVIGLDLSSSFLYGSINSSSTLFSLVHLQRLNLSDNDFNYSQIPSGISHLSRLSSLDLSNSVFSGQIPSEILGLSKLISLDLCCNFDGENLLKLEKPSLRSLVQNLTNLKELSLSHVNIFSAVPDTMANLSSLTSLFLRDCSLHGEFPVGIFHLQELQGLSLRFNYNLTGYLPEFNQSSRLKVLILEDTSFSGKLPDSIGNLNSLNTLLLSNCSFSGSLSPSLGNLTHLTTLLLDSNNFTGSIPSLASLYQLSYLSLSDNQFNGGNLSWLCKLNKLTDLRLSNISLYGEIPSSLANLTQLTSIDLSSNQLVGQIPSWLMNLTQLTVLELSSNHLQGPIPCSFSKLENLEYLSLVDNHLNGTVEANIFLKLQKLRALQLSDNNITLHTNNKTNATLPKFDVLGLSSCNLREFPYFLRFQDRLEGLFLSDNNIHGHVPEWMWNISKKTLETISIYNNFLTGFDQLPAILPWVRLCIIDLSHNMLQGSLPVPPLNIFSYTASNNFLTGEIPLWICRMSSLYSLSLANNYMSGTIPPCIVNFSSSLSVLDLKGNNFSGTIPETFTKGCGLRMVDLSRNHLEGQIPRSLASCTNLENLNLGDNQMQDIFPFWLGALSKLQVLILKSNKFHGAIESPKKNAGFLKLLIIDLSNNNFVGSLPLEYFHNWNGMKKIQADLMQYLTAKTNLQVQNTTWQSVYPYSMTITNKGLKMVYENIPNIFAAIDLSSNKFRGEMPESIGDLKGLLLLNLSNNELAGQIPPTLGNLTNLESLDLSQNKLSGVIPTELVMLNFLAVLNVSYNNLSGPIPRGKQFDTFQNNSYEGNSALCGDPLSKPCVGPDVSTTPPHSTIEQADDSKFPSGVDWIVIFMGFGSGLVVGLIIGQYITTKNHEWFVEKFENRKGNRRRQRIRGQRSRIN